jgi:hypothetical protein
LSFPRCHQFEAWNATSNQVSYAVRSTAQCWWVSPD